MNVLVVAAHPDDEVLGAGATIARLSEEGHDVHALILGEGAMSRENADAKQADELKKQAQAAAKVLGVKKVHFGGFPDNQFDSVALLEIARKIENVRDEIMPELVFTHHFGDLNVDHRLTHYATLAAFRPLPGSSARKLLSFEVLSSTEWNPSAPFVPSVFYDASTTLPKKLSALGKYSGEMRQFPHPRSIEAAEALAKLRGSTAGFRAAEAFSLVWERA